MKTEWKVQQIQCQNPFFLYALVKGEKIPKMP